MVADKLVKLYSSLLTKISEKVTTDESKTEHKL